MSFRKISSRNICCTILASLAFLSSPAEAQDSTQQPPQDGNAVALVNGHPIARDELMKILLESHGVDVLQQMILLRVAKQELQQRDLKITKAEVTREFQSSLDSIAENAGMDLEDATEENKRKALQQVLDERGISLEEFMIGMERNAYLRKLAELDMRITDETLREEFARKYGARVQIRHIQVPQRDSRTLNQAVELLGRGSEFADVARRLSKNAETAARGGLMEPFTFDDPDIPAALKETAFSLKEGGISNPVLVGQFFHIVKFERRIPPENVRFEDVREEVEQSMRQRALPQAMSTLAIELFKEAKIKVLDSTLRPKYQEFLDRGQSAQ